MSSAITPPSSLARRTNQWAPRRNRVETRLNEERLKGIKEIGNNVREDMQSPTRVVPKSPTRVVPKSPTRVVLKSPTRVVLKSPTRVVPRQPTRVVPKSPLRRITRDKRTLSKVPETAASSKTMSYETNRPPISGKTRQVRSRTIYPGTRSPGTRSPGTRSRYREASPLIAPNRKRAEEFFSEYVPSSDAPYEGTDVQPIPGQAVNPYTGEFIDIDGDEFSALLFDGWRFDRYSGSFVR